MATEVFLKARSTVAAQASAAITASNYSAGSQTVLDRTTVGGNSAGCWEADIYVVVSTAPTGAATAEIWMEASNDNTTFCVAEFAGLSVAIPASTTGTFHVGSLVLPKYCKIKIKAVTYGFTASLSAVPQLLEAQ